MRPWYCAALSPCSLLLLFLGSVHAFSCHHLVIDYCVGCQWGLRSVWMGQELLTKHPRVNQVTLQPSNKAGTFVMWQINNNSNHTLLWDRKEQGGFPELDDVWDALKRADDNKEPVVLSDPLSVMRIAMPNVEICFTPSTLLRAAYLGQELLRTFDDFEIRSITLSSSHEFTISLDCTRLFHANVFPATKVLKQKVRDALVPHKNLGHSDVSSNDGASKEALDTMDDDEAEDARRYFGVA